MHLVPQEGSGTHRHEDEGGILGRDESPENTSAILTAEEHAGCGTWGEREAEIGKGKGNNNRTLFQHDTRHAII